ncbi:MAG: hypothetical protein R6U98_08180 [Pirellulaceae bacterium]
MRLRIIKSGCGQPSQKINIIAYVAAENLGKPFERLRDSFLDFHVEDPYIWWVDDRYEMIAKDQSGTLTGEFHGGVHATSTDGIEWTVSQPPKVYSRTITCDDGTTSDLGSFERPQLLIKNGKPVCLYCATADGPGGFKDIEQSWNVVIEK